MLFVFLVQNTNIAINSLKKDAMHRTLASLPILLTKKVKNIRKYLKYILRLFKYFRKNKNKKKSRSKPKNMIKIANMEKIVIRIIANIYMKRNLKKLKNMRNMIKHANMGKSVIIIIASISMKINLKKSKKIFNVKTLILNKLEQRFTWKYGKKLNLNFIANNLIVLIGIGKVIKSRAVVYYM